MPFVIPYPDIDPAIFTLAVGGFEFSLRWYALAYIAGLVFGWRMVAWLVRRPGLWPAGQAPMTREQPEELLTWMTLGVVVGGRLGYVLFYDAGYYLAHPAAILAVWNGGMSFHGGMLGVVVALVGYCLKNGIPVWQAGDAVAVAAPIGLFFGRIANFINAELWGRPTDVSWAMRFPMVNPETGARDMDLLTEPRHPSQLYEAGLEGIVLFAVLLWLVLSRRWLTRPGAVTGAFLAGYGAARVFVGNFRQADAQFVTAANPNGHVIGFGSAPDAFGLTMGQLLSLPMIALGLAIIVLALRRPAPA